MQAICATVALALTTLAHATALHVRPGHAAPRISLSRALDWNNVAQRALTEPSLRVVKRPPPALTVTTAAPPPPPPKLVAAYDRLGDLVRDVAMPHYTPVDPMRRHLVRQLSLSPFSPYPGAYGAVITVETDALMR